jgi:hypothetical protein
VHQEESRKADKEIGEIDLLGLDIADRLWVVELKVAPNTDTPLKALYQGLRYSAIVDLHADGKGRQIDPLKIRLRSTGVHPISGSRRNARMG